MTKILNCKQASDALSVSRTTLYRLTRKGVLSKIQISEGRVGWLADDLDQYVRDQVINSSVA